LCVCVCLCVCAVSLLQGREALEKAKEIAESQELEVIYGDTDSIMIHTRTTDYNAAKRAGENLQNLINKTVCHACNTVHHGV
jgi:DNA polymerase alpha subunit A